ncbi:MAG: glycosyltransferase family 61 protein [Pseudomonadota bacterium]
MTVAKEIRRFLNRHFGDAASLQDVPMRAKLARRLFKNRFPILPLVGHIKVADEVAELAGASICLVATPTPYGGTPDIAERQRSPLKARLFKNVIAGTCSAALVKDRQVAIPEYYLESDKRIVFDQRFLLWYGAEKRGLVKLRHRRFEQRPSGISLFGSGTYNWYHWLIEQLPAAYLAEQLGPEFKDLPFIIPEEIADKPSFRESLALFTKGRAVETLGSEQCRFENLLVLDVPIEEPVNMAYGAWPEANDYAFNADVMRGYREAILDRLGIEKRRPERRIFLARRHGRRSYNQDDALKVAARFGVEPVYPEDMTFKEQVQMMHDATYVVGPSGAAFATTLFCQPGTQLLSWLLEPYRGFCSYTNLATIAGTQIHYIFTPSDQVIHSTSEAFTATYELNLKLFEDALEGITQSAVSTANIQ